MNTPRAPRFLLRSVVGPRFRSLATTALLLLSAAALPACGTGPRGEDAALINPPELIASSPRYRWTGVAVDPGEGLGSERIFVNFPDWNERAPIQVAEITGTGDLRPYPNGEWQKWSEGKDPSIYWVCVQSVHMDQLGRLWVLDAAAPGFQGPVAGGAKLVEIDTNLNEVQRIIRFDDRTAPPGTYLNDVRIDPLTDTAFITDSGRGGLVIVDLSSNSSRRILDRHPLTTADPDRAIVIDGTPFTAPDGSTPQIHSDGIAINPEAREIYFQPITGTRLTAANIDDLIANGANAGFVTREDSHISDGMHYHDGYIYLSALEMNAITAWRLPWPETGAIRRDTLTLRGPEVIARKSNLSWPDSFAIANGYLYVTTAQIHTVPPFEPGAITPPEPYRIFRVRLKD